MTSEETSEETSDAVESGAWSADLDYRLAEGALRARALWAGAALSLSLLMPFQIVEGRPHFVWELFGELPAAGIAAALAEAVAGLLIVVGRCWARDATALGLTVVTSLFAAFVCRKLGADASTWGLMALPESLVSGSTLALVGMAATAAGASLMRFGRHRRAAIAFLVLGVVLAVTFFCWPGRGRAPALTLVHNLSALGALPTFRLKLGLLTVSAVTLWPAAVTLAGLLAVRYPALASRALPLVAQAGFPLLLMMLSFVRGARDNAGAAFYPALGAALELAAVIVLLAAAFEVIGHALSATRSVAERRRLRRQGERALVVLLVIGAVMLALTQPPAKGGAWKLEARSDALDALFGRTVLGWARVRDRWDGLDESARLLPELERRAEAVIVESTAIDAALGRALGELTHVGRRRGASARAWHEAVDAVNTVSRRAGRPYYLDPEVRMGVGKEGVARHFSVGAYLVLRARRFAANGELFAVLHVHALGEGRGLHRLDVLGLSRDLQPAALVSVEATQRHAERLTELAFAWGAEARCGRTFEPEGDAVLARCGARLAALLAQPELLAALNATVERHELQHQMDGPMLPLAPLVLEKLAGGAEPLQRRVNRELSAYLAELTSDGACLHVALVTPLRLALLEDRGAYHHAAVLLFEALGDVRVRDPRDRVAPGALGAVFDRLVALDEAALRARAADAWREQFGAALPEVRLVDEVVAPEPSFMPSGAGGDQGAGGAGHAAE